MNYRRKKNREKFIKYWNDEVAKKLFRCSKEYGFYNDLKKSLGTNSTNRGILLLKWLDELLNTINERSKDIIEFSDILTEENEVKYPVYATLYSKVLLSHLFSFYVLSAITCSKNKRLEHQKFVESFNWLTNDIFSNNKKKIYLSKVAAYTKLFFI